MQRKFQMWCVGCTCRSMDGNRLQVTPEGTLSPVLANLTGLTTLSIQNTLLGGSLYDEWAEPGSFPELTLLQLLNNSLDGPLPSSWGTRAAFPELLEMWVALLLIKSACGSCIDVDAFVHYAGLFEDERLALAA